MSKRTRPRSTRGVSRKESGIQGGQGIMEDLVKEGETFQDVPMEISPKQSSSSPTPPPPPPGFAPLSTPTVCHRYGTRQAKASWFTQCGARASLRSLPSPSRRAQRIIPGPKEINTAASENLPLDVEQQTEATNLCTVFSKPADHATEEVHYATSSTANRPENESYKSVAHPTRSDNFNLTEILQLVGSNDDEEVNSAADPSLVKVDGYRVKAETAPVIKKIFARYGDIVKESTLQSVEYRSSFLESVCSIYQRLDTINLLDIASGELKSMLNLVNDLELAKVEVGWLRCRLEQILEAKKLMMEASSLKATKMKNLQEIEEKKKAIAETKQELVFHAEACRVLHEKLKKLEDDVGSAGIEMEKISESYSNMKFKVKRFYQHPLVRDLL